MGTHYRIQSAAEPVTALLDPSRTDGWVASDESAETEPDGVSCCDSIADLAAWVRYYAPRIDVTDRIVRVHGRSLGEGRDRYETRVQPTAVDETGIPATWLREYDPARLEAVVDGRARRVA
jgi:hypothetical protein